MSESATECRKHAAKCKAAAVVARSPNERELLLDMARTWERMAVTALEVDTTMMIRGATQKERVR
jgi:hypothetical protein